MEMIHSRDALNSFVIELIEEGRRVAETAVERQTSSFTSDWFVDVQRFSKWRTSCKLLIVQLGTFGVSWVGILDSEKVISNRTTVNRMIGALESICQNILAGRLARLEDIVYAKAFSNLIDQANYLLEKGY